MVILLSLSARVAAPQSIPSVSDLSQGPQRFSSNPLVVEGDRLYARRQDGRTGSKASAGPIGEAIVAYEEAAKDPAFVEARWKLVRAL